MALSKPRKKRIIYIIVIISDLVQTLIDNDELNTPQEQVLRLVGRSEWMMNEWDTNESNWSAAENDLASLIDDIYAAHAPEVLNQPVTSDYENWIDDLTEKIGQV